MKITNNFNHKTTPSLQKKIEIIENRFETSKREKLIQAYISRAKLLVVDSVFTMSDGSVRYKRTFYGTRGGWNGTKWYLGYDYTENEPIALSFEQNP